MQVRRLRHSALPSVATATFVTVPAAPGVRPPYWHVDRVQAARDAQRILARIDFTKPNIVINVPGTGDRVIIPGMQAVADREWHPSQVSVVLLDYDTNWNFARSIPHGVEVLRQVLAGIAERANGQRVFLWGQSQGALITGEAMQDPAVHAVVTRASIFGHPWVARSHYPAGTDPKVWEHNNGNDPIAQPISGAAKDSVTAISQVYEGQLLEALPVLAGTALRNIAQGLAALLWIARGPVIPREWWPDPHGYEHAYDEAFRFLTGGMDAPAPDAAAWQRLRESVAAGEHPFPLLRDEAAPFIGWH